MSVHLNDVREGFQDMDFQPLHYSPELYEGLQPQHKHLAALDLPDLSGSNLMLSGLVDTLLSSELVEELKEDADQAGYLILTAAKEIKDAVQRSLQGTELIHYRDLPQKWRSNQYINTGYRRVLHRTHSSPTTDLPTPQFHPIRKMAIDRALHVLISQ